MNDGYPFIQQNERVVLSGRTGSGKSSLAKWLLLRSPGHWVIVNPKWTAAFNDLPGSKVLEGVKAKEIEKSIFERKFTIINPNGHENNPDFLDDLIGWLHSNFENVGVCVDELYSVHKNGRAGPGVVGLLTRGRELKQPFLGCTQRPAFVSQFVFSEANHIVTMALNLPADRKRMVEVTGDKSLENSLPEYYWNWYTTAKDKSQTFGPVPT